MTSQADICFEEALLDLKKVLNMHSILGVFGPMRNAYYHALRNKIARLVILANRTQRVPAGQFPIDVDGLRLLVEIRRLVKGLKREDLTTESLDSIISPRVAYWPTYIYSKGFVDMTLDEVLHITEILQTLKLGDFGGLDRHMSMLGQLHLKWLPKLAETSEDELEVSVLFAYDPRRGILIWDSAIETVGRIKLLVVVNKQDR